MTWIKMIRRFERVRRPLSGDMQSSEALNGGGTGGEQGCLQGSRQIGEDGGASKNELAVKKSVLHW